MTLDRLALTLRNTPHIGTLPALHLSWCISQINVPKCTCDLPDSPPYDKFFSMPHFSHTGKHCVFSPFFKNSLTVSICFSFMTYVNWFMSLVEYTSDNFEPFHPRFASNLLVIPITSTLYSPYKKITRRSSSRSAKKGAVYPNQALVESSKQDRIRLAPS